MNDLHKHYKNLLQKNCNLAKQDFPESLNAKPIDSVNILTTEEIKESIKYLRIEKAPDLEKITNE